jgi:hypothetical protein
MAGTGGTGAADFSGPNTSEEMVLGTGAPLPAQLLIRQLLASQAPRKAHWRLRQHERYPCCVKIVVQVEQPGPGAQGVRELAGVTQDISAEGLAFVCNSFVQPGAALRVRFEACDNDEPLAGIARRCEGAPGGHFLVGVQFVRSKRA